MIISKLLGVLLLILLSPFLLIVSFIILFDDGRPVIFKQKRIGRNNLEFDLYKFRTMKNGIPDIPTHLLKSSNTLFTKSGPLLRMLSIDELPQLINIIKGEMVFIGPRPALHNQPDLIELRTSTGVHRLMPGVTGWAQVNGRDELSIPEKVKYDEHYLLHKSLVLNCKIMIKTILKVLKMHGVSH
jgi:O-antigen biosynthesis protein WbqP